MIQMIQMIHVDQLIALTALEKEKSFHRAAASLGKSYGAFSHLIQTLETRLDLKLIDRSGYRSSFTAQGRAVLQYGIKIQQDYEDFHALCETLRSGFEPNLQIVSDGIFNQQTIIASIKALRTEGVATQVETFEAHLEEVENEFRKRKADLMILLSPLRNADLPSVALKASRVVLVCAKHHPLANGSKINIEQMREHDFVTIRGSKEVLGLSTSELERRPTFTVGDFNAKRGFISSGLAYGWLPEEMIKKELKNGALKKIQCEISNTHTVKPRLYHRPSEALGKAAVKLIEYLKSNAGN